MHFFGSIIIIIIIINNYLPNKFIPIAKSHYSLIDNRIVCGPMRNITENDHYDIITLLTDCTSRTVG